ncbi:CoA-transferase subunit beta [Desulfosporosinus metallidurans]|uniref:3-oxoadipate CoA-transferase subunit B n=1 Tax=Desulfosporosinus metallidurans TaxID=1888891 RepID=A0A1Q8QMG2_9FIRM|nr:CoA-transferase [Desulfosporosinus metallidurans]OLN28482.1 3-oxoadipate CoA-transferase subunit B [Desulfosporosinus metallidurans]
MNYGPAEMMVVALAREIKNGDLVFHGLASPVPMTAMKLAKALGTDYTYVNITGGVDPDWHQPALIGSTLSDNLYEGGVANFGLDAIFDLACTGRVDISMLSLVQISPTGEINMSFVGGEYDKPKVRLPGGAGSATLIPVTKKTLIWKTKHDLKSFVPEVTFCTAKADPTKEFKVITNLCIFALKNGLLEIESIHPYSSLDEVKSNTGWEITQSDLPLTPAPTEVELALIEEIDPNRIRDIEF